MCCAVPLLSNWRLRCDAVASFARILAATGGSRTVHTTHAAPCQHAGKSRRGVCGAGEACAAGAHLRCGKCEPAPP